MVDQAEVLTDLGSYLKAQREIAQLSLRHLARMTHGCSWSFPFPGRRLLHRFQVSLQRIDVC